jgi:hypothetical protein
VLSRRAHQTADGVRGRAARAFRAGANLAPGQAVGHRTWEDFLADNLKD